MPDPWNVAVALYAAAVVGAYAWDALPVPARRLLTKQKVMVPRNDGRDSLQTIDTKGRHDDSR